MKKSKILPNISIWNKRFMQFDGYRSILGIVLIFLILGAGFFYLLDTNENKLPIKTEDAINTLVEQNEDILIRIKTMEEKHNQLVSEIAIAKEQLEKQVAGQTTEISTKTTTTTSANKQNESQSETSPPIQQPSKTNLNSATSSQLDGLPGIGPVYASRIIEYRETNGGFKTIEEVMNVKGIGPKTFEKMKDRITI